MELSGRIALVTGAGSGLGAATAMRLAEAGADVALLSRSRDELEAVARRVQAHGRQAEVLVASVADAGALEAAYARIRERFGRLDILFANAGINGTWAPLAELAVEEWRQTIDINLTGTFLTLKYAVPLLSERGGAVVITSSINGTRTFTTAGAVAYASSKAGQLALGQMAALELARQGIRVNVICPGAIDSDIEDNTDKRNTEDARVPAHFPEGTVPLTRGRSGTPEDVAELVAFLVSDRARHITGTPVWIDGAQSLLV
jgi:NAD(P)-dependent dehydrogenase (short-subunit alcohol dehydrogenase family)